MYLFLINILYKNFIIQITKKLLMKVKQKVQVYKPQLLIGGLK